MTIEEQQAFAQAYRRQCAAASEDTVKRVLLAIDQGTDVPTGEDAASIMEAYGIWCEATRFELKNQLKGMQQQ